MPPLLGTFEKKLYSPKKLGSALHTDAALLAQKLKNPLIHKEWPPKATNLNEEEIG
jgi:hypothetical protein